MNPRHSRTTVATSSVRNLMQASLAVGGLTPLTTIDYPGELAAVVFCAGCPWRCSYCHNRHLIERRPDTLLAWPEVLTFLERRRALLDAVVFSGGEPTLQRGLDEALRSVRRLGFKVGLHTAGCYPRRLRVVLPLVDWIGLDIKDLPEHYPALTGVRGSGERAWESLALVRESGVPFQVRTTVPVSGPLRERVAELQSRLATLGVEEHRLQPMRPAA